MLPSPPTSTWADRQRTDTRRLAAWTAAWLATLAIATFGSTLIWPDNHLLAGLCVLVNLVVGLAMMRAQHLQLQGLDELQRRLQLEAMAFSLGLTLVAGIAYSLLDVSHLIRFHAEIAHLVAWMGVTYLVATLVGRRRIA
ncbi:MAG: hypothetical protein H6733_00265 [Alphaproteobacteria bacterium]|nr:hypothetical protein [Alphaproteobacteria bacterium]